MLIGAALASQFSAAVADTAACGGLTAQVSGQRLPARAGYAVVLAVAIALLGRSIE